MERNCSLTQVASDHFDTLAAVCSSYDCVYVHRCVFVCGSNIFSTHTCVCVCLRLINPRTILRAEQNCTRMKSKLKRSQNFNHKIGTRNDPKNIQMRACFWQWHSCISAIEFENKQVPHKHFKCVNKRKSQTITLFFFIRSRFFESQVAEQLNGMSNMLVFTVCMCVCVCERSYKFIKLTKTCPLIYSIM